jgi:2-iminobutanoate/2-iminopropanoate deaminase
LRRNFVRRDPDPDAGLNEAGCCLLSDLELTIDERGKHMRNALPLFCAAGLIAGLTVQALSAEYLEGTERQKSRAYSPAVITEGGRTVWLAGQLALTDAEGRSLAGNFEGQVREIFRQFDLTLKRAGGSVKDMVTMTVFINDPRNGDRFVQMRHDYFPEGHYPGSALITVSNFAVPGVLLEIQGVAVIGDKCSNASPCSPK